MANFADMQQKMRAEIDEVAGDEIAHHDYKARCHYVNSFIAECLRFRAVTPYGVSHKAMVDSCVGPFPILKGTTYLCTKLPF